MLRLRRYFVTGLLVVLPLFLTFYFLFLIFKLIDGLFGGIINSYLKSAFGFFIPGLGFILGIFIILFVGFIASHFLGKKLFPYIEKYFLKVPCIRQIYPSIKQIVGFFLSQERNAFKRVVLVEYPAKGIWSVGFITGDGFKEAKEKTQEELIHIFIPTTPGPWTGFLVLIPKREIKFLDMPIEEGIKLIVSGGILKPIENQKIATIEK